MFQREFPFAIQGFGNSAGHGRDRAEAVVGEIGAVGRIYTDQGEITSVRAYKSAQTVGGRS